MELSVGVGLTNACDLACAHCYRDVDRIDQLTQTQVVGICDDLPVRSVNLGTGENGLHPDYAAIVSALADRGVKLSLTSNGYSIERAQRLGLTVTVLSVMMKTNYRRLPAIAEVAFAAGANYRVNVYQPVKADAFTLSYEEFWEGWRR